MASVVYFASADVDVGTPIKIGSSRNAKQRVKALRCPSSGLVPTILATIPGTLYDEHRFQDTFVKDRVCGEWFSPSPALLAMIGRIKADPALLPKDLGLSTKGEYVAIVNAERGALVAASHRRRAEHRKPRAPYVVPAHIGPAIKSARLAGAAE